MKLWDKISIDIARANAMVKAEVQRDQYRNYRLTISERAIYARRRKASGKKRVRSRNARSLSRP